MLNTRSSLQTTLHQRIYRPSSNRHGAAAPPGVGLLRYQLRAAVSVNIKNIVGTLATCWKKNGGHF